MQFFMHYDYICLRTYPVSLGTGWLYNTMQLKSKPYRTHIYHATELVASSRDVIALVS